MQIRVGSRAWKSGRLILGLALIGTSCGEGSVEGTKQDDPVELSSSASTPGTTTAYEAENLTSTSSAIGSKVTSDTAASGGKYVEFNGTAAAGAWIEFTLTNIVAGSYDLKVLYKSNNNRGIVQASLDGVNQGSTCNEYAAAAAYKVACSLGSKTLTAGSHKVRFTVTGKGSGSSGYQMVVDQVSLTSQDTCASAPPPQFAQDPQSYAAPCNSTAWVRFTAAPSSGTTVASVQWHVQYPGAAEFVPDVNNRYYMGQNTLSLQVAPQTTQYVWATITDQCGRQVSSSHALLTAPDSTCDTCASAPPPQFAQDPQSYAAPCNSTAWVRFTAAPSSGTTVASVQWHAQYPGAAEFVPDVNNRYYMGQNTLSLQVAPQSTQYVWATITDTCGRQVSSSHALLTVPDSTCDGCSASGATSSPPTRITVSGTTPVCSGSSRTLTVSGGSLGTGASWVWYTNSSHTASIGTGASIAVSPSSTTTYYVRAEGPCNSTSDASQTLSIVPPPQFAQNPQSYAAPCNSTAWVSFTAAPSSGTTVSSVQWHVQFPGQPDFVPASNARYWTGQNTLNLQIAPQDSQYVWCTITDVCNVQVSSSHALLSVPDPATCP